MIYQDERWDALKKETGRLRELHEQSGKSPEDYFEPGEMGYLDQNDCTPDGKGGYRIRFEVRGTRYEGRTELIERVKIGDPIRVERETENLYNTNNFRILSDKGKDLGNMPADLCNAIAPLYDDGSLRISDSHVSFVEPISKRNRYALKGVLFVELSLENTEEEV